LNSKRQPKWVQHDNLFSVWFDHQLWQHTTKHRNIGTSAGNYRLRQSGLSPNTTYHFQIVASNSGGTSYGGDLTFTTTALAQAPTVSTLAANNVTSVSAQLNAGPQSKRFEPRRPILNMALPRVMGVRHLWATLEPCRRRFPTRFRLSHPGTIYHYRLTASNSNGTTHGSDQTFTTTGTSSPTAQTLDATSVTTSTAQLNGS
jgi:hypothetical protein